MNFPDPISNIQWIHTDLIDANDYNPNVVFDQELKLLEHSILVSGWLHAILLNQMHPEDRFTVIDGFHRYSLSKISKQLKEKYHRLVPAIVMQLSEPERMLLTIRINRAKGTHIAFKMADIIKSLMDEHGLTSVEIGKGIGATQDEVKLLYEDSIFKKLDLQNHKYSKAWITKEVK